MSWRGRPNLNQAGDRVSGGTFFASPGVIPPHSYRFVRVTWLSDACMGGGGGAGIDQLWLKVRVGTVTRTEHIPLNQAFDLTAVHSTCR